VSEQALRQGRLARADREHDLVLRRELLRDLEAGVSSADDENGPRWHLVRPAVADGVRLRNIVAQLLGELRHVRRLEGARRDNDLVRGERPSIDLEAETPVIALFEFLDLAVQLNRQLEGLGVGLEVGDHLIPGRVAIRIAREREARQRAVPPGREESERLPALPPGGADRIGALEDHESTAVPCEEIADGQARLPSADHGHVGPLLVFL